MREINIPDRMASQLVSQSRPWFVGARGSFRTKGGCGRGHDGRWMENRKSKYLFDWCRD